MLSTVMGRVPVTLLTGFLGSGKTTLLNNLLDNKRGMKIAVIENEFGEVGIDDHLIRNRSTHTTDEVVEMMNGCICCTVRSDLIKVLKRLLITEKRSFDAILIETTGLADPAPVVQTFFVDEHVRSLCSLDAVITVVDARHIEAQLERERPAGVENEAEEQVVFADRIVLNKMDLLSGDEAAAVRIENRLRKLNPVAEIIRCERGRVEASRLLGVQGFSLERILEFEPKFLGEEGSEHQHDPSVKSLCIVSPDAMSVHRIEQWIERLIAVHGQDLLRYKGVMHIQGMDSRFVFQGVHMLFSGTFATPWKPEERRVSKFVFIGRNLDVEALQLSFFSCRAEATLRFAVGDAVLANVGTWEKGRVLRHWDEGNAYRIELEDGTNVWGPIDDDSFVRAAA
jgi:G3E family GTPase